MLRQCLSKSSAHGIPKIAKSNIKVLQFCWALFTLGGFAILFYHTYTLLVQFFSIPTNVAVIPSGKEFVYPDIYFCNQMTLSGSYILDPIVSGTAEYQEIITSMGYIMGNLSNDVSRFNAFWQNIPWHKIYKAFGHRLKHLVLALFDAQTRESLENLLEPVPNWRHLVCYRLRTDSDNFDLMQRRLLLYLYTDANTFKDGLLIFDKNPVADVRIDKMNNPDKDVGFKFYVVPRGEYPHMHGTSFVASAGFWTTAKIGMEFRNLLNSDNFPCTQNYETVTYINPLTTSGYVTFNATDLDCVYEMYHREALQKCGCTTHIHPISHQLYKSPNFKFCHVLADEGPRFNWNETLMEVYFKSMQACTLALEDKIKEFNLKCLNYSRCATPIYSVDWEVTSWPGYDRWSTILDKVVQPFYQTKLLTNPGINLPGLASMFQKYKSLNETDSSFYQDLYENFVKVSLAPGEIYSRAYRESRTYEIRNLMSDIGGLLGFYLGISVLTLCEIIGLFSEGITNICSKDKKDNVVNVAPAVNKSQETFVEDLEK